MPKIASDYSNSVIYKIECKNKDVKDIYIGRAVNLKNRIHVHKSLYINKPNHLYNFMFENGGFDNWDFIVLENCNINSSRELDGREQYWIDLLKPTLNKKTSKFISYDGIECNSETNKDKTYFRVKKEREELLLLRKKIIKLENILKLNNIDINYDDLI